MPHPHGSGMPQDSDPTPGQLCQHWLLFGEGIVPDMHLPWVTDLIPDLLAHILQSCTREQRLLQGALRWRRKVGAVCSFQRSQQHSSQWVLMLPDVSRLPVTTKDCWALETRGDIEFHLWKPQHKTLSLKNALIGKQTMRSCISMATSWIQNLTVVSLDQRKPTPVLFFCHRRVTHSHDAIICCFQGHAALLSGPGRCNWDWLHGSALSALLSGTVILDYCKSGPLRIAIINEHCPVIATTETSILLRVLHWVSRAGHPAGHGLHHSSHISSHPHQCVLWDTKRFLLSVFNMLTTPRINKVSPWYREQWEGAGRSAFLKGKMKSVHGVA